MDYDLVCIQCKRCKKYFSSDLSAKTHISYCSEFNTSEKCDVFNALSLKEWNSKNPLNIFERSVTAEKKILNNKRAILYGKCSVQGCSVIDKSLKENGKPHKLFRFPKKAGIFKVAWQKNFYDYVPQNTDFICDLHFRERDLYCQKLGLRQVDSFANEMKVEDKSEEKFISIKVDPVIQESIEAYACEQKPSCSRKLVEQHYCTTANFICIPTTSGCQIRDSDASIIATKSEKCSSSSSNEGSTDLENVMMREGLLSQDVAGEAKARVLLSLSKNLLNKKLEGYMCEERLKPANSTRNPFCSSATPDSTSILAKPGKVLVSPRLHFRQRKIRLTDARTNLKRVSVLSDKNGRDCVKRSLIIKIEKGKIKKCSVTSENFTSMNEKNKGKLTVRRIPQSAELSKKLTCDKKLSGIKRPGGSINIRHLMEHPYVKSNEEIISRKRSCVTQKFERKMPEDSFTGLAKLEEISFKAAEKDPIKPKSVCISVIEKCLKNSNCFASKKIGISVAESTIKRSSKRNIDGPLISGKYQKFYRTKRSRCYRVLGEPRIDSEKLVLLHPYEDRLLGREEVRYHIERSILLIRKDSITVAAIRTFGPHWLSKVTDNEIIKAISSLRYTGLLFLDKTVASCNLKNIVYSYTDPKDVDNFKTWLAFYQIKEEDYMMHFEEDQFTDLLDNSFQLWKTLKIVNS